MIDNINLATKDELISEKQQLESDFNSCKFILNETYQKMIKLKEQFDEIETQLKKRNGEKK